MQTSLLCSFILVDGRRTTQLMPGTVSMSLAGLFTTMGKVFLTECTRTILFPVYFDTKELTTVMILSQVIPSKSNYSAQLFLFAWVDAKSAIK